MTHYTQSVLIIPGASIYVEFGYLIGNEVKSTCQVCGSCKTVSKPFSSVRKPENNKLLCQYIVLEEINSNQNKIDMSDYIKASSANRTVAPNITLSGRTLIK